jgi:hypothetical protein
MFESVKIDQVFGKTFGVKQKFTLASRVKEICSVILILDPLQVKNVSVFLSTYNVPIIGRWSLLLNDETDEVIVDANILTAEDLSRGFMRKTLEFPVFKPIIPNLTHTIITKLDDLLIDALSNELREGNLSNKVSIDSLSGYLYLESK